MTKPTVSVIAWDMGHNALGRAYVIADLLRRSYEVEIVGAHFVNSGADLWPPLRNADIPMRRFEGTSLPHHFRVMESVVENLSSDILFASKPRLPSYGLGILAKEFRNRPLLLDTDDRELAFFDRSEPSRLWEVSDQRVDRDFVKPFGRIWTQYCESLVPGADAVTVSNVSLQRLVGGTVIPHARDETVFDPRRYDRAELRRRLGLAPDHRAVMFAGTPRSHKGLNEIVAALAKLGDERNRLCVFRTNELDRVADSFGLDPSWLVQLPYQTFDRLPETVVCADLACILQDPASEISRYQIPAKITDAIALGVPCLVRRTPSLEPLIDAGAVFVVEGGDELHHAIRRVLDDPEGARHRAERAREVYLESYSYSAVRPVLEKVVESAAAAPAPLDPDQAELLAFLRSGFSDRVVTRPEPDTPPVALRRRSLQLRKRTKEAPGDGRLQSLEERVERAERAAALAHGEVQRLVDEIRRENQALDRHLGRRTEVERVRKLVDECTPVGATVAVVSRGDVDLCQLGPRTVGHFPSTEDGAYAGYHPGTSEEAIEHLGQVAARGTDYLVVPASAAWWREQYPQFWTHLHSAGQLVRDEPRAGAVFALGKGGT